MGNQIKLKLVYKIVSEYILDNAWSDKDIEKLGKLTPLKIIEDMKKESYMQCECPCCLMQGINNHYNQCLFDEWLKFEVTDNDK